MFKCNVSRRTMIQASLAAITLGTTARADGSLLSSEETLRRALSEAKPPLTGGAFDLLRFEVHPSESKVSVTATVQLDWPHGMRRRKLTSTASDELQAVRYLSENVLNDFYRAFDTVRTA